MNQSASTAIESSERAPIVVVMGHIDHGKTTILDWYRKANVVASESGGITQHIGAYEVRHGDKSITFIDTPGHEAFSKIRSRGARIADIAILVVAADEGVKPQTKEAIEIIEQSKIPFIVAFNKMDKAEANPERVKQELARENILVESYGGQVPSVEVSAKKGTNMDSLLETILLVAEMQELKATPSKPAIGVVLETHRDPKRGISATFLVQEGSLKRHDIIVVDRSLETIKILADFMGDQVDRVGPSSPALVAGLSSVPNVGEPFLAFPSKPKALEYIKQLPPLPAQVKDSTAVSNGDAGKPIFNIIIKADVVGSKEAIEESLKKMSSEFVGINILRSTVGDVGEDDVKLALATHLVTIIAFKVKIDPSVRELATKQNIHIVAGDIIYSLLDNVKAQMQEIIPPILQRTNIGKLKVLKFFKKEGSKQIIGGRIDEGVARKGAFMEVSRNKEALGRAVITHLQSNKKDAEEVQSGNECGIMADAPFAIQEGDSCQVYTEEKIRRVI
ncbi:MAG: translation initiation factor IF-2 [bacterium]|nr:translation initiation factor IF-2 [bacterium]